MDTEELKLFERIHVCPTMRTKIAEKQDTESSSEDEQKNLEKMNEILKNESIPIVEKAKCFLKFYNVVLNPLHYSKKYGPSDRELIEKANFTRIEQLAKIKVEQDGEDACYSFYGKNCEDCGGWDGISKRCNCGNRRVDWTGDISFLDENDAISKLYAEAD